MSFDMARRVADAVLYEGYMLYPYRASATKNQVRWQFGVLTPPAWSAGTDEPWFQRTECLVEERDQATLHIRLRFLQVQGKRVERAMEGGGFRPVESLEVDGVEHFAWDEGVARDIDEVVPVAMLVDAERDIPVEIPGGTEAELLRSAAGVVKGRLIRERWPIEVVLRLSGEVLPGPYGTIKLTLRTENTSSWAESDTGRPEALRRSLVAAHTLMALTGGEFISLLDPPEWAKGYVKECSNEHTWPCMVGEDGDRQVMLSSPIILYDYPQIAPESAGDLFDATEIDEILLLRTMTLTDEEKREARATDPRAAAIIDRADHLPPELLERLHGAVRYLEEAGGKVQPPVREPERPHDQPWWDPGADTTVSPETDAIDIAGVEVSRGSKVVLRPRPQRADAQDLFLEGRVADVQAVFFDVDGNRHLAVTLEGDPGADIQQANGRFLYFLPDEVEPLGVGGGDVREPTDTRKTMVAGIGNIFLGDDGFGVEVVNRLLAEGDFPQGVRVEDYGIRGLHLAYELMNGYDTAILIDAVPRGEEPGTVFVLKPDMDDERLDRGALVQAGESPLIDSHGMDPMSVFALLKTLGGSVERVLIVGCEPADVSEHIGLSERVAMAVDSAAQAVRELLQEELEMASSTTGGDQGTGKEGPTHGPSDQGGIPVRSGGAGGHVAAGHQEVSADTRDVTRVSARGELIR